VSSISVREQASNQDALSALRVITKAGTQDVVVWEIEPQTARIGPQPTVHPAALPELVYGLAPEGYISIVPAQALIWGETYRVVSLVRVEPRQRCARDGPM
jgi:hypothetical protein